ncbi:MAG: STAS domain-containing protein [Anaerolineae bacterium]|nr:STAS domain-containing protein [Anaerolineae bacterium]
MNTIKKTTTKKTKTAKKKARSAKPVTKKKAVKPVHIKEQMLKLDPVLVINNAKSLSQDFSLLINSNQDINIDASGVEMIDTAVLQLLLTITIKLRSTNHKVNWINPSAIFISNASLLGLTESFGLA